MVTRREKTTLSELPMCLTLPTNAEWRAVTLQTYTIVDYYTPNCELVQFGISVNRLLKLINTGSRVTDENREILYYITFITIFCVLKNIDQCLYTISVIKPDIHTYIHTYIWKI